MQKVDKIGRQPAFFGVSALALLLGFSVAQAQTIIDGGQHVTVPGSQASPWNTAGLYIGNTGIGELTISSTGIVNSTGVSAIGLQSGSNGTMTVTGPGAQWNVEEVAIGYGGIGTLTISNGGTVTAQGATIGNGNGSNGTVNVTGTGSHLILAIQALGIGHFGIGALNISNGGIVDSRLTLVGELATGTVTVTGAGSLWNNSEDLTIGYTNTGTLDITDGGTVSNAEASIGYMSSGIGSVTVTGTGSQWISSSGLSIGLSGTGTLAVAGQGTVTAHDITLAVAATGSGMLAIGTRPGTAPTAPGTVSTESIRFGAGDGSIVFNHTSSSYVFDATLNNGADNAIASGTGLVGGGLVEGIAGRTILNASHGDFTGILQASDAGILQVNGDISRATANILTGGTLEGNGIVGATENAGTIAPGASIGTLTVAGTYIGNGGVLAIEAVLGNDNSPTDRLIVTGNVSGSTTVRIINLGGSGAQTANGIQIIRIGGISPDNAFSLSGDYVTETGHQAAIGGAYAYTLQHGGTETPADGNWYLVSELFMTDPDTGITEEKPRYQPGVPLYEQYPMILASLNTLPTLQQRVGNRYWSQGGANGTPGTYGMWGRIEGSRTASDPARSDSQAHRDIDLWKLQTGFDAVLHHNADGSMLIGGVNISYGTAFAEIGSPYGHGKIDTTGTGVGASLTWYDTRGFYIDAQAQAMWFDSDITSTTIARREAKGNDGNGYALSLETGQRFQIGNGFSVTPQVQLIWSKVEFDSFTDPFGTRVSSGDNDSLRARFGASLDHEISWVAGNGTKSLLHVHAIANLYNEFLDGTKVNVAGVPFRTRDERLWAGIGLGGTYEWDNGRYAVYGNANLAGSTRNPGDSYALGGMLGFRAKW